MGATLEKRSIKLDLLFNQMPELNATDLHLKVGNPPIFRIQGELHRAKSEPLTQKHIYLLVEEWLGKEKMAELHEKGSLDIGHDFGRGRVRVNVFLQTGSMVFQRISLN